MNTQMMNLIVILIALSVIAIFFQAIEQVIAQTEKPEPTGTIPTLKEFQPEKPFFFLFNSELPAYNVTEFPPDIFSDTTIVTNDNDEVTIYFYNQEVPGADRHSFTINAPYNIDLDVAPSTNSNVTFTTTEPGVYRYYCQYHEPTMSGQLIVLPTE